MLEPAVDNSLQLAPLPYQEAIRDFLKAEEPEVWKWYASHKTQDAQADAVRFDLLKSTYRIDRDSQPALYTAAEDVAAQLSLDVPITIYQAQNPQGLNAALAFLPNEGHIIFQGPLATRLSEPELRALLAHELSHLLLWKSWGGEFLVADQILAALTHDRRAQMPHFASARLFGLYNEIFCDRGALFVVQDPLVVVSMLVKVHTGLETVSAESYIKQADEIFSRGAKRSGELTHPETFIRARAIALWHESRDEATLAIAEMIEGPLALNELDLLAQRRVAVLTRRVLDALLAPKWMQTESILAHARLFFDDYSPPDGAESKSDLPSETKTDDTALIDYYCYLLMDFVTADRELDDLPLAAALSLAEQLGLKTRFVEIVRKELRLTKKQLDKIDKEKEKLVAEAGVATENVQP
ncbi:MAG: M48 family metalloprotease [Planctomycetia bacterium]|nr:M48 family metalloprotease [Planctomycetia bacterium]